MVMICVGRDKYDHVEFEELKRNRKRGIEEEKRRRYSYNALCFDSEIEIENQAREGGRRKVKNTGRDFFCRKKKTV